MRNDKKSDNRFFDFFTGKSIITGNGGKKLLKTSGMQKLKLKLKQKNHSEMMYYIGSKQIISQIKQCR